MVLNNIENRNNIIKMIKDLSNFFNTIRDELCEPYGISSVQAIIILDIYNHPDSNKITDICKRLHKTTNSISPLINRLVSYGLLEKVPSKEDKRITYVNLTKKSKEITKNIAIDVSDYTWPFFETLSDEQFDKIYTALELLLEVTKK